MKRFNQILYTDDDVEDGEFFKIALEEIAWNKDFHFFEDGKDLFKFLSNCDFIDNIMLFIDFNMPLKDGLQCVKEIRSKEEFRELPVIIYSTAHNEEDILKCYDAGANLYIRKPASLAGIREILKKVFKLEWDHYFPKPGYKDFYLK